jgi:hypothetical protein
MKYKQIKLKKTIEDKFFVFDKKRELIGEIDFQTYEFEAYFPVKPEQMKEISYFMEKYKPNYFLSEESLGI